MRAQAEFRTSHEARRDEVSWLLGCLATLVFADAVLAWVIGLI